VFRFDQPLNPENPELELELEHEPRSENREA
jgi:hypothetical protein